MSGCAGYWPRSQHRDDRKPRSGTIGGAGKGSVRVSSQESGIDQGIEDCHAEARVDTTEALRLRSRQSHAGHLEKFAAESLKRALH